MQKLLTSTVLAPKTAWAALLQDYEAYKATERGVKVFIEAIINETWICNLHDPEMFYSNNTALAIFNYLCERSGGLHALTWYRSPFK
jgi:hypothetical protein